MNHSVEQEPSLPFTSILPTATPSSSSSSPPQTILLIHGACSNAQEWSLVTPHLPNYHILLPDLPRHGLAKNITPFSIPYASTLLASLIRAHADSGRAHVVGLSLGAHIALHMASHHSDVCLSVFATGYRNWGPKTWVTPYLPTLMYLENTIEDLMPRSVMRWATGGADVRRSEPGSRSQELMREWVGGVCEQIVEQAGRIERGVLVVAATALGDRAEDAGMARDALRGGGEEGKGRGDGEGKDGKTRIKAVYNARLSHPWNRQEPELFARTVVAWIEGRELHEGFVDCD